MASNNEIIYKTKGILRVNDFIARKTRVDSDIITIGSDEWRVSLEFETIDGQHFVGFYLRLYKSTEKSIEAEVKLYILDIDYHRTEQDFFARHAINHSSGWGWDKFIKHSTLLAKRDRYLPNNCLTIGFNVTVYKPLNGNKIMRRFVNSFNNKDLSDCRLVIKGKELFASKAILSDKSEVFYNMFTSDMSEKTSNEVVIDDIEPQVFEEFLRVIYFGDSNRIEELAEELLYVSEKYMVLELKTICLNLIYLGINVMNAFNILEVMDKYKCEELKAKVMIFIKENMIESLDHHWYKMVGNDVSLARQLSVYLKTNCAKNQWSTQIMSYTYLP